MRGWYWVLLLALLVCLAGILAACSSVASQRGEVIDACFSGVDFFYLKAVEPVKLEGRSTDGSFFSVISAGDQGGVVTSTLEGTISGTLAPGSWAIRWGSQHFQVAGEGAKVCCRFLTIGGGEIEIGPYYPWWMKIQNTAIGLGTTFLAAVFLVWVIGGIVERRMRGR